MAKYNHIIGFVLTIIFLVNGFIFIASLGDVPGAKPECKPSLKVQYITRYREVLAPKLKKASLAQMTMQIQEVPALRRNKWNKNL